MNDSDWILKVINHLEIYQDLYVLGTVIIGGLTTIALLFLTEVVK